VGGQRLRARHARHVRPRGPRHQGERLIQGAAQPTPTRPDRVPYAGIATRAIALALDVALIQVVVFTGGAVLALVGSLVSDAHLGTGGKILAACAWVLTVDIYFVAFWTATGQTPAMRLMELRVVGPDGEPPGVGRAIVRMIGLYLAIIPLFAGFLPVLIDDRRRALQDMLAGTVVIHAGMEPPAVVEPSPATVRAGPEHGAPA
jgi:uncharacterized RDD family membrane protein YckC